MEDLTYGDECQNFHVSRFYLFPLIFFIYCDPVKDRKKH